MSVVERDERGEAVAQNIRHLLKMVMEFEVLLLPIQSSRILSRGIAADIPTVLLTIIHSEPAVAQLGLESIQRLAGRSKLPPRTSWT